MLMYAGLSAVTRSSAGLLLAAIVLAGCGTTGSSDEPTAAATPAPAVGTDDKSVEAVEAHLQDLAGRKDAARKAGDTKAMEQIEQAMQKIEREQEAAYQEEFGTDTPFDRAVDSLPLDKPPLYVEQFVLDDAHELVDRVRPKRFFCGRTRPASRCGAHVLRPGTKGDEVGGHRRLRPDRRRAS